MARRARPPPKTPATPKMPTPPRSRPAARTSTSTLTLPAYDAAQPPALAALCRRLRAAITRALPTAKAMVWHGSPVWFVGEVPVVGYCVGAKGDVQLLFWNGQAFGEAGLALMGQFHAAQARYRALAEIDATALDRWLAKAATQLWDLDEVRQRREKATAAKRKSAPRKR